MGTPSWYVPPEESIDEDTSTVDNRPPWEKRANATPTEEPKEQNWAGTGEAETTREYFEKGFLGRIGKGLGERVAYMTLDKNTQKLMDNLAAEEKAAEDAKPKVEDPSVWESLSEIGKQAVAHPWDTAKNMAYELGRDPELLAPVLWEGAPAKLASIAAKMGTTAKIATTTARAAAIGGVAEVAAQAASMEEDYNLQKIENTAAMFGAFAGVTKGVVEGVKGVKGKVILPDDATPTWKEGIKSGEQLTVQDRIAVARQAKNPDAVPREKQTWVDKASDEAALKKVEKVPVVDEIAPVEKPRAREDYKVELKDTEASFTKAKEELDYATKTNNEEGIHNATIRVEELTKKADDIRQAMPKAEFVDKADPHWTEVHDLLSTARNMGEALDLVREADLGGPGNKALVEMLGRSSKVRDAALNLSFEPKVHEHPTQGAQRWAADYNPATNAVSLHKDGGLRALLHEGIHASVMRDIHEGVSPASKAWNSLFKSYKEIVKDTPLDKEYGFQDVQEYIAEGFTNPKFQKMLSQLDATSKYISPKQASDSLWGKFKAIVKEHVGLTDGQGVTALDHLLDHGAELLKKNMDLPEQVAHVIEQENLANPSVVQASAITNPLAGQSLAGVVRTTLNNIRSEIYLAEQFAKDLTKSIPLDAVRKRMTMAMEKGQKNDVLISDADKKVLLFGDEHYREAPTDRYGRTIGPTTGKPGLIRTKAFMDTRLANDKAVWPHPKTLESRESYAARAEKLGHSIKSLIARPSEDMAIKVLPKIQAHFERIGEVAKKAGVIDGMLENYVTHILNFKENKLSPEATKALLDKLFAQPKDSLFKRDFTEHRQYATIRALEKILEGTGIIVEKDLAKVSEIYTKSMQTAILHKQMVDHFKLTKDPYGRPYITDDLHQGLANKFVPFNGKGASTLEGLLVHPDLVDIMGFAFRQSDPGMVVNALGGVSHLTKALNTVASLFHATSLLAAGMTTAPAFTLKTIFTKGSGNMMAFKHFQEGIGREGSANWLKDGLVLGTEDIKRSIIADLGTATDSFLSKFGPKIKLAQHATDPLDRIVIQKLNHMTWDFMHTGQKLNMANHLFGKIKAKNPEIPDAQIRQEVASYVNNTFGGLDWLGVADQVKGKYTRAFALKAAGIQGREWAQILLFAPDWTVSTLRAFSTALPKELNKPANWQLREGVKGMFNPKTQGDLARRYIFNTGIAWLTILNGANIASVGHPIWENKDPTRIELEDGTSMQAAKHNMEAVHFLMNPDKFAGNKLGFWPKALFVATTATAYPSPTAPKLKDTSFVGRAKAIALLGSPFAISAGVQAPEGQKLKRAISSTIGLPIYGQQSKEYQSDELRQSLQEQAMNTRRSNLEKKFNGE